VEKSNPGLMNPVTGVILFLSGKSKFSRVLFIISPNNIKSKIFNHLRKYLRTSPFRRENNCRRTFLNLFLGKNQPV